MKKAVAASRACSRAGALAGLAFVAALSHAALVPGDALRRWRA